MTHVQTPANAIEHQLARLKAWPLKIKIIVGALTGVISVGSAMAVAYREFVQAGPTTTTDAIYPSPGGGGAYGGSGGFGGQPPVIVESSVVDPPAATTTEPPIVVQPPPTSPVALLDAACQQLESDLEQVTGIDDELTAMDQLSKVTAAFAGEIEDITDEPEVAGAAASMRDASDKFLFAAQLLAVNARSDATDTYDTARMRLTSALQALSRYGAAECTPLG